jgi:riboflavin biosynthesis pyrimidine reductase
MSLGKAVPDSLLAELTAEGISSLVGAGDERSLEQPRETLTAAFGLKRLLLEGGAHAHAEVLKAGRVEKRSLGLFPAIRGRQDSQTRCGGR